MSLLLRIGASCTISELMFSLGLFVSKIGKENSARNAK